MLEQTEYRLALIIPQSRQLLGVRTTGAAELPRLTIPTWERPVEQLTRLVEEKWKFKTIVLEFLCSKSHSTNCAVMEVRNATEGGALDGLDPINPEQLGERSLGGDERRALRHVLSRHPRYPPPFSRFGWIDEAQQWIRETVSDSEIRFNSDILQLNTGGGFALIRFGTENGRAYWLKAAGEPNVHEFWITTTLANLFPDCLPRLVAARKDWNAWVSEDAGWTLRQQPTFHCVEQAVQRLTDLQTKSVDYAETLMERGFMRKRIATLQMHLDAITEYLEEAMGRQTSTKVLPLTRSRLHELRSILNCSCSMMIDLEIPDTLVHNDLNEGNILYNGSRCVFTDWAETFVGNPFLSFEAICLLRLDDKQLPSAWVDRLRGLYRVGWRELLTSKQIDQAFVLAPILAILSHLYGVGSWLHSDRRADPAFQAYARSLARYIDRAATEPALKELLCH